MLGLKQIMKIDSLTLATYAQLTDHPANLVLKIREHYSFSLSETTNEQ